MLKEEGGGGSEGAIQHDAFVGEVHCDCDSVCRNAPSATFGSLHNEGQPLKTRRNTSACCTVTPVQWGFEQCHFKQLAACIVTLSGHFHYRRD